MEIILSGKVPNRDIIEKYIEDNKKTINEMASPQNEYLSQPEKIYVRYHGQDRKLDIYKGQSRSQLKKIGSIDNYSEEEMKARKIELLEHIKEDPRCMVSPTMSTYRIAEKVLPKTEFDRVRREAIYKIIEQDPTEIANSNMASYKIAKEVLPKTEFDSVRREAIYKIIEQDPTEMVSLTASYRIAEEVLPKTEFDSVRREAILELTRCNSKSFLNPELITYIVAEKVLSKEEFDAIRRDALHKWIEENPTGLANTYSQFKSELAKKLFTKYKYSRLKGEAIIEEMSKQANP